MNDTPIIFKKNDKCYYLFIINKKDYLKFKLIYNNIVKKKKQYNELIIKLNNELNKMLEGQKANEIKKWIITNRSKLDIELKKNILTLKVSFGIFTFNWKVELEKSKLNSKNMNLIFENNFNMISNFIDNLKYHKKSNLIDLSQFKIEEKKEEETPKIEKKLNRKFSYSINSSVKNKMDDDDELLNFF